MNQGLYAQPIPLPTPTPGEARAWVVFAGATGNILSAYNVGAVKRNGVGDYTVTFVRGFANGNYASCGMPQANGAGNGNVIGIHHSDTGLGQSRRHFVYEPGTGALDVPVVTIIYFGVQA